MGCNYSQSEPDGELKHLLSFKLAINFSGERYKNTRPGLSSFGCKSEMSLVVSRTEVVIHHGGAVT